MSFNVGKNMNDKQLWEATGLVLKEFPDLKVPDIKLCFDRAKSGRYGKAYDRVDVQIVCDWISQYDIERMEEIAALREKQNGEHKLEARGPLKALERMKSKEIEGYVPVEEKDSMQEFFNQKYSIWERLIEIDKFKDENGFRFINRYGKKMSGSDYVAYKLQQKEKIFNYLKTKKIIYGSNDRNKIDY